MSILKRLNDTFQQVDQAKTLEIINIIKKTSPEFGESCAWDVQASIQK